MRNSSTKNSSAHAIGRLQSAILFDVAGGGSSWDLAPDGKRVAVVTPLESAEAGARSCDALELLRRVTAVRASWWRVS
jgi:hypothetical protein